MKKIGLILLVLFCFTFVYAESNITENNTINDTLEMPNTVNYNITLLKIIPDEFNIGDNQFNVKIQSFENKTLENLYAFVSGKGFSSYDVMPIDSINPGERGYILVKGNFRVAGQIELIIKIEDYTFYQNVTVIDEKASVKEQEDTLLIINLTNELENLESNFTRIENLITEKKKSRYDVSKVDTNELKKYIKNLETSLLIKNTEQAQINSKLANEEIEYLDSKISKLEKISFLYRFKDYAILFSTIAGAFITFFALYELLKKKSAVVVTKIVDKK